MLEGKRNFGGVEAIFMQVFNFREGGGEANAKAGEDAAVGGDKGS